MPVTKEAITRAHNEQFDAAVIDMKMVGMDGLQELKEIHPQLIGVILTGHGSISNAVEATKLGAYDYLTKPCDISELETVLIKGYHGAIKAMEPFKEIYHGIVGKSSEIKTRDIINLCLFQRSHVKRYHVDSHLDLDKPGLQTREKPTICYLL